MEEDAPLEPGAETQPEQPAIVRDATFLAEIMATDNVADLLSEAQLSEIADQAIEEYTLDKESMSDWLEQMKRGLDLAALVKEAKTYPWPGASNVKYPLVTTAALQFNAKAYPAIVPSDQVVKVAVQGQDPQGIKAARASRVSEHMSFQLTSDIEEWEETTDSLLTVLPIVGTMYRKVWWDPSQLRIRCRLVMPGAFVVNDGVRMLSEAPRCTEELEFYPADIAERVRGGTFRDVQYELADDADSLKPVKFIEQHRRLDLDDDGYSEPYIVTVACETKKIARIVADFEQRDIVLGDNGIRSIRRSSYFIPYKFAPSLNGGWHGTGLGLLLGDISETVNSTFNMLIDAGHMASRGGGFIGSGFRIKGGNNQFRPGEWKTPGADGAAIKDNIVPLTFPGPDATLFQMLGMLVDAAKEISSVKDLADQIGANTTATTTMALVEQGMAVFTAVYKRIFRSLKHEFRLIAKINARHVSAETYSRFHDAVGPDGAAMMLDPAQEYDLSDMDIMPVADPASVTRMQKAAKAQVIMEAATNGLADPQEASRRLFEAAAIEDVEKLVPKPDPMQQQMAALQTEMLNEQLKGEKAKNALALAQIDEMIAKIEKTRADTVKSSVEAAGGMTMAPPDFVLMALMMAKDGLAKTLAGGLGGMAAASGIPVGAAIPQPGFGGGAGAPDPMLLGGPSGPGGIPAGVPAQGGIGGGPF